MSVIPGWTLRYAALVGTSVAEPERAGGASSTSSAPRQLARQSVGLLTSASPCESGAEVDSAFSVSKGRDKRLNKWQDKDWQPRQSRYSSRRTAVTGGRTKFQVGMAIRMMTLRHPEHMRRLNRVCEQKVSQVQVLRSDSKELSSKQLDKLTGRKGLSEDEVRELYSVFNHYDFDESGTLDREEVRNVLADLGLQPRTREEKVEVHEILCDQDLDGHRTFQFNEFLTAVKAIRERLRQIQMLECLHLFDIADRDDSRSLDIDEVWDMLEHNLGLAPRTEDERIWITTTFQQCDGDGDGQVDFEEFQDFVQRIRAKLLMTRREMERTIGKAFHLDPDTVAEFRSELPLLWDIFTRYLAGGDVMHESDVLAFLMDAGVVPSDPDSRQTQLIVDTVIDVSARELNTFPAVLAMIQGARRTVMECLEDDLRVKFNSVDRNHDGCLPMKEIYQILEDFRMLPRTREEQQDIAEVISTTDRDGSGTFDFNEFADFIQRMTEQVRLTEREREHKAGVALGFNEGQLVALRRIFMHLAPDESGKVGRSQLVHTFAHLRAQIDAGPLDEDRLRGYLRTLAQNPDRALMDFVEILKVVRGVLMAAAIEEPHPLPGVPGAGDKAPASGDTGGAGGGNGNRRVSVVG